MIGNAFDVLRSDNFGLGSMIAKIDKMPFVPGLATSFFRVQSIDTLAATFEVRDNVVTLQKTSPRGSVGNTQTDAKADLKSVAVPHIQVNDRILADSVQGKREFGTTNQFKTVDSEVNRHVAIAKRNLLATWERHCLTALAGGVTLDTDASTIVDSNALFGVSANAEQGWDLTNAATTGPVLRGYIDDIVLGIQDALKMGPLVPMVGCIYGPTFRKNFTNHSAVQSSFDRGMGVAQLTAELQGFQRESHVRIAPWYWQGVWWHEFRGGSGYGLADDKAIFFPIVPEAMEELYPLIVAPADYVETVNTMGLPFYSRIKVEEKWADLEAQTNPLAVVTRPLTIYRARSGA